MFESGLVDRLVARSRQVARLQAALLADLVAVADATPVAEFAPFEIASALTWSRRAATAQLDLAQDIVRRLPGVHRAMAAGNIDLAKARVICEALTGLELSTARGIASSILPTAPALTTGQLRARLAKLVIEADPSAAATRHRTRLRERRVVLQPTADSCATLLGLDLPADAALAASNRLTDLARALKQAGDPRTLDQLRADTFLNLLRGNTFTPASTQPSAHALPIPPHHSSAGLPAYPLPTPPHHSSAGPPVPETRCYRGGVELVATLQTLTRLTEHPGHLNGYGPVIADIARQVALQQRQSPWSFTVRDETTGRVFTGPTRRRPSAALARQVRSRDRTCRAPGCRRPATHTDLDHTIAYELGGLTVEGNLGSLCRYHHRAKHQGRWLLRQTRPGTFSWRSPLGRRYVVSPEAP